jgi:hypothetical protein
LVTTFPLERNGALFGVGAPVRLDNANVVIDGMTQIKDFLGAAEAAPLQNESEAEFFRNL